MQVFYMICTTLESSEHEQKNPAKSGFFVIVLLAGMEVWEQGLVWVL